MGLMDYRIEITKHARLLELHSNQGLAKRYSIQLGGNPAADKVHEGDGATPEGEFYICAKNPRSKFHLSLCISYPNVAAADRGLRDALIDLQQHAQILEAIRLKKLPPQKTPLGGEIYIHGQPTPGTVDTSRQNWTRGCIALDNESIKHLYDRVSLGTAVTVRP
jgi:murein L,D-transpeptidase YafK